MFSSIVTNRIALLPDLQVASGQKQLQWRGRTMRSTDFSSCLKLRTADRKLRSGKLLPSAPSVPVLAKKKKVKKEAPVALSAENNTRENTPDLRVGIATIFTVDDGKAHPLVIKKAKYALQEECYVAQLPPAAGSDAYTQIGHITFSWLRPLPTGSYGSETCKGHMYELYGADVSARRLNKIFVTHIEHTKTAGEDVRRKYKGVGTALMQAAVEWGLAHGCQGRTSLLAINNSHGFYYKLGMRSHIHDTHEHDSAIAAELAAAKAEQREPNTASVLRSMPGARYAQGIDMYFPQAAIDQMKERITRQTIFQPAKEA